MVWEFSTAASSALAEEKRLAIKESNPAETPKGSPNKRAAKRKLAKNGFLCVFFETVAGVSS